MASVLIWIKLLSVLVILIGAVLGLVAAYKLEGGALPCCTRRARRATVSLATTFSGGVIISAALVHLLPDAQEKLDFNGFPLGGVLAGLGVILVIVMDASATDIVHWLKGLEGEAVVEGEVAVAHGGVGRPVRRGSGGAKEESGGGALAPGLDDDDWRTASTATHAEPEGEVGLDVGILEALHGGGNKSQGLLSPARSVDTDVPPQREGREATTTTPGTMPMVDDEPGEEDHIHGLPPPMREGTRAMLAAAILFIALSIHSLVAGLALGVSTTVEDVTDVLIAIVAHKTLAAFALGRSLTRAYLKKAVPPRATLAMVVTFMFSTPTGILVGLAISPRSDSQEAPFAGILAVAAGMFLHVGTVEMISRELGPSKHLPPVWVRSLAAITGFGLMSLLANWV